MKVETKNLLICLTVLFVVAFLLFGKPVPAENEFLYLLRLFKTYRPDFLANDFTYSVPANEHWLFNHLFGSLTFVFSLEVLGWLGRVFVWCGLFFSLFKLGKLWEISPPTITVSLILWLFFGQSIVADEWVFGGFEAKTVAYICLLSALEKFAREEDFLASILLGLTFSFHPAVGFWAIPAVGVGLLVCRWNFIKLLKVAGLTFSFALFGIIPLLSSQTNVSDNFTNNWKFIELVRFPWHFDPFSWEKPSLILLFLLSAFCFLVWYQREREKKLVFLNTFLATLGVFFVIGFFLRVFEQYDLLRLMPFRIFPVLLPLFFFFTFFRVCRKKSFSTFSAVVAFLTIFVFFVWQNPFYHAFQQAFFNYQLHRQSLDDEAKAFLWLKDNTPKDSLIIAQPWRKDFWYYSHRGQVVSYSYPLFEDLDEWRNRVERLIGKPPTENSAREPEEMKNYYENISFEEINEISQKYQARYLVSEGIYPYPVLYKSGNCKVYQLQENGN